MTRLDTETRHRRWSRARVCARLHLHNSPPIFWHTIASAECICDLLACIGGPWAARCARGHSPLQDCSTACPPQREREKFSFIDHNMARIPLCRKWRPPRHRGALRTIGLSSTVSQAGENDQSNVATKRSFQAFELSSTTLWDCPNTDTGRFPILDFPLKFRVIRRPI